MIEQILSQLDKVRSHGPNKWQACCPAHADRSPSFGIKLNADGQIVMNCFAGCEKSEILGALGIRMQDLFPDNDEWRPPANGRPMQQDDWEKDKSKLKLEMDTLETRLDMYKALLKGGVKFDQGEVSNQFHEFKRLRTIQRGFGVA